MKNGGEIVSKGWIKGIVIVLVIIILGAGGYYYFKSNSSKSGSATGSVNFLKAKVVRGDVNVNVSASGSASSSATQNVDSTVTGTIDSFSVAVGDTVKSGDIVATVSGTNITSPINGVITAVVGSDGASVKYGAAVATVADTTSMQVIASVDETDISKVSAGQSAKITFDALSGKIYDGKVSKVSAIGKASNNVTTYDVTISITNPTNIKIGMNGNVIIPVNSKTNVLMVPVEAIRPQNGKTNVLISDATQQNGRKLQEVQTGLANETYMEIVSGLKEGDIVLIPMPASSSNQQKQQGFSLFRGMGGGGNGGAGGGAGRTGGAGGGVKIGGGGQ